MCPSPPPILHRHNGSWQFGVCPNGTVVTSRHFVEINTEAAAAFLREAGVETQDADDTHQQIKNLIRNNSLQTMLALKKRLEQRNGRVYVSPEANLHAVA